MVEVEDGQASMTENNAIRGPRSLVIRPAMNETGVHPPQKSFFNRLSVQIYLSADSAHISPKAKPLNRQGAKNAKSIKAQNADSFLYATAPQGRWGIRL